MGDRIVVNVKPWTGEYEFDIEDDPLTTLEWRWVKKISGYLPMTIDAGLEGGDPDLFVAFAVVAMHRAGRIETKNVQIVADKLAEAPFDGTAIQYVGASPAEDDADPPVVPAQTPETGGDSLNLISALSANDPSPTGAPDSEKSSVSDRLTSVG